MTNLMGWNFGPIALSVDKQNFDVANFLNET